MFKKDAIHIAELMIGLYEKRGGGGYSQKEALKFLIKYVKQCKCQKNNEFSLWHNTNKWDEEFEDSLNNHVEKDEDCFFKVSIRKLYRKYLGAEMDYDADNVKVKIQAKNDEIRIKRIVNENKK